MSEKYQGVIPAFYACYGEDGEISVDRVKALASHLLEKKVSGVYVGGSSGECIYQSVAERKAVLEAVMSVAKGKMTVIAHVACNNTKDSQELAKHAESQGVDAIASIPPIYFKLPELAIAKYWNDISAAAPNTDFIMYNIPQLAGVSLSVPLLKEMKKNPRVIGVKNSSMPTQDIQMWKDEGVIVFNGPDEQWISGLAMGAIGAIGGTHAVMPELFIAVEKEVLSGNLKKAQDIQNEICRIIYLMCSGKANLYAIMKEILRLNGLDIGSVRAPLTPLQDGDPEIAQKSKEQIAEAIKKYC
ncbi:MAG: dihydrodipicolinate synthase family protein [Bacillota bacterium]